MTQKNKSDSSKRLEVENFITQEIARRNPNLTFSNAPLVFGEVKINVDLYSTDMSTFYEIYSGIKDLKPGQKRKLLTDILKLNLIEKLLGKKIEKKLVLVDNIIEVKLRGIRNSWSDLAIKQFDIEVIVINLEELDEALYREVEADKKRQKMK